MKDIFFLQSSALPDDARLIGFRGIEGLSRPYEFEIHVVLVEGDEEFDMADAIGGKATLSIQRDEGAPPFVFHGLLSTIKLVHELGGRALYRAVLVPHLWQLSLTRHSRIFTKLSIPDILEETLQDGGLSSDDYELRLDRTYEVEEHVCQYQESHLDFIHRWMEREGMYYFFEQGDAGEKMIITDHLSFHGALAPSPVRYHPVSGRDVSAGESLHTFTCQHSSLPASVRFSDYDYTKPNLEVSGTAPVSPTGIGEVSLYGARFFTPDKGKRLAEVRAEELLSQRVVFFAAGAAFHMRPGYTFTLDEHPRGSFNAKYLATGAVHFGNQAGSSGDMRHLANIEHEEVYRVEVTAIKADVQFRPAQRTPWPRIYGYENGTIDGPADSQYAQIDDHGRYAVKFKFDESDLKEGKASTFVRMMQPHGGGVEGFHFPLRKGTEIVFTFLGGDPDRPVIAGVVPNAHTPSPVTSTNHTTNVLQTGGRNRFELEDQDGSQRVTLSTPTKNTFIRMGAPNDNSNLYLNTDGMTYIYIGEDLDMWTVGHKKEWVDQTVTEEFMGPFKTTVTHTVEEDYLENHKTTVATGREETIKAGGNKLDITGGSKVTIKGGTEHTIKDTGLKEEITGPTSQKLHGPLTQEVDGAVKQTYKTGQETTVTGEQKLTVNGNQLSTINGSVTTTITGGATITSPAGYKVVAPTAWWKITASSGELSGLKVTVLGAKLEANGLAVAVVGFKTDISVMKVTLTAVNLYKKEIELKQAIAGLRNFAAACVIVAAIHIYT